MFSYSFGHRQITKSAKHNYIEACMAFAWPLQKQRMRLNTSILADHIIHSKLSVFKYWDPNVERVACAYSERENITQKNRQIFSFQKQEL